MANPCVENFVCDYCKRDFTRKYNLRVHISNCHLNSDTSCNVCSQTFGSPSGMQLHYARGHNTNGEPFPECDVCGRTFKRRQNIVSHMITIHSQGGEIVCQQCEKTFTTQRNLKRHLQHIHNPQFPYLECDNCSKIFKGKHSLIAHIQATHDISRDSSQCHICKKVYTNKRNLKRHVEALHGEGGLFKCPLCPKVYTTKQSLRRHSRVRHRPGHEYRPRIYHWENMTTALKHSCKKCEKDFEEEPLLRQHVKSEHSFKAFYRYCRESLLKRDAQKTNFILEQTERATHIYECEFCESVFISVYDLKDHMKVNHDKDYSLSTCNVCFEKFYSKEFLSDHKKVCVAPPDAHACSHCERLFTELASLEFHTRIFHPQAQIADSNITSTNQDDSVEDANSIFKCVHCDRVYYSDRSLKHHTKLKHTTDEVVQCNQCGKICSNKYYLASHIKIVHTDDYSSKCDYCEKEFRSKRNIRRHIEHTHLGMQRYKCVECETLFKEKRSLRKHVRTKHPESTAFPQCHLCHKRFESAKSCKIHLKLVHSFNMNTHPCHLCSVSFNTFDALKIHIQTSHLAEDEIYKCEECNLVFKGYETFDRHNEKQHLNFATDFQQKVLPRCIICMKDFSTRKTLKRHIKKFHLEFEPDELATFGSRKRVFEVDCEQCLKRFTEDLHVKPGHRTSAVFTCEVCFRSYSALEFAIQQCRQRNFDCKSKLVLSDLCTAEMSGEEGQVLTRIKMEPESTTEPTEGFVVKTELLDKCVVKSEPLSP